MSALIDELKKEHSKILASLNEANEIGLLSREVQDKLMSAKAGLFVHLKMEDELLYPALRKEAKNNKELKAIIDLYAKDMEGVSRAAHEFFDEYYEGVLDTKFVGKFESLLVALGERIKNEEDLLFEEYEKIKEKELEDSKKEGKGL